MNRNYISNYPFGALHDPNAPWNQEDAKPVPHWVSLQVRIDAVDEDHAVEQVVAWLKSSRINGVNLNGCDWQVDSAEVDGD